MSSPHEALAACLRRWVGDDVSLVTKRLPLGDAPGMVRVARPIVDSVVREILPLPQRYGRYPDGLPELASLAPITDEPTRTAAWSTLTALKASRGSLALGSAAAALHQLGVLERAGSLDDARQAWTTLFNPTGTLAMALLRTARAGVDPDAIRAALAAALHQVAT